MFHCIANFFLFFFFLHFDVSDRNFTFKLLVFRYDIVVAGGVRRLRLWKKRHCVGTRRIDEESVGEYEVILPVEPEQSSGGDQLVGGGGEWASRYKGAWQGCSGGGWAGLPRGLHGRVLEGGGGYLRPDWDSSVPCPWSPSDGGRHSSAPAFTPAPWSSSSGVTFAFHSYHAWSSTSTSIGARTSRFSSR